MLFFTVPRGSGLEFLGDDLDVRNNGVNSATFEGGGDFLNASTEILDSLLDVADAELLDAQIDQAQSSVEVGEGDVNISHAGVEVSDLEL